MALNKEIYYIYLNKEISLSIYIYIYIRLGVFVSWKNVKAYDSISWDQSLDVVELTLNLQLFTLFYLPGFKS